MHLIKDIFELPEVAGEVGIEIEMEGVFNIRDRYSRVWGIKVDGSLGPGGQELYLRKPIPRDGVHAALRNLSQRLEKNECEINNSNRCGTHVHLNVQQFTVQQVINLAVLYLCCEDLMMEFCGERRRGNIFCLPVKDASAFIVALMAAQERASLLPVQRQEYRYANLNLTSVSRFGSAEWRAMYTPEDFSYIETWVKLLLAVKDASLEFRHPRQIIEKISWVGPSQFLKDVFKDLYPIISSEDEENILFEGTRLVQEIAFAGD